MRACKAGDSQKNSRARIASDKIAVSGYLENDGNTAVSQPGNANMMPEAPFVNIQFASSLMRAPARPDKMGSTEARTAFGQFMISAAKKSATKAVATSVAKEASRRHQTMSQAFSSRSNSGI